MSLIKNNPTYDEVVAFCQQQIQEGVHLDYKKDLSATKNIAKTICAFANTQGGTIIVGVEDLDNKPKLPVIGMPYNDRLSTQVVDIILGNIYNPIVPNIHVCEPSPEGNTFIVITVPESNNTPHALDNDSKIYIRTHDISDPNSLEILADMKRIEWLWSRRKKSEEFREELKLISKKSFKEIGGRTSNLREPLICLTGIPLYPSNSLIAPQLIKTKITPTLEKQGHGRRIPKNISTLELLSVPNGVVNNYESEFNYFCELNQFGLYTLIQSVEGPVPTPQQDRSEPNWQNGGANLTLILSTIDLYLESLGEFYKLLNFYGLVEIDIFINLKWIKVKGFDTSSFIFELLSDLRAPLDNVHYRRVINSNDLIKKREILVCDVLSTICWDIGFHELNSDEIKKFLQLNGRL